MQTEALPIPQWGHRWAMWLAVVVAALLGALIALLTRERPLIDGVAARSVARPVVATATEPSTLISPTTGLFGALLAADFDRRVAVHSGRRADGR